MPSKPVKSHTFKLGKYDISECLGLDGCCDLPDDGSKKLNMLILEGGDRAALSSSIHEALHAEGVPIHVLDGDRDPCREVARFLIRRGWRRNNETQD